MTNSVTYLGSYAFEFCAFTSISIPDSIQEINAYCFADCSQLSSIQFPDILSVVGGSAFMNCGQLTNIVLPESVTAVGGGAFRGCSQLSTVRFSAALRSVSPYAFMDCPNLSHFYLSESMTEIPEECFAGFPFTTITIPNSVTKIGSKAFWECDQLISIVIPDSVESIGSNAFGKCLKLKDIILSKSLTYIGSYAFYKCEQLTEIVLPDSLKQIDYLAFAYSCITDIYIPNSVEKIQDQAFAFCSNLKNVEIPNSVTYIGERAFECCANLSSVILPESLRQISYHLFSRCTGLKSIILPDSIQEIGSSAFLGCTNLNSIAIPDSVESVNSYAFYNCKSLKCVEIPDSVTILGSSAFENCTSLEEIRLSNSITAIYDSTFAGCSSLASIELPNSVSHIYKDAFASCTQLKEIIIPEAIMFIDAGAFRSSGLEIIQMPSRLMEIEWGAFRNSLLKDVYYPGTPTEWERVKIDSYNEELNNATIHFGSIINANLELSSEKLGYTYVPEQSIAYSEPASIQAGLKVENKAFEGFVYGDNQDQYTATISQIDITIDPPELMAFANGDSAYSLSPAASLALGESYSPPALTLVMKQPEDGAAFSGIKTVTVAYTVSGQHFGADFTRTDAQTITVDCSNTVYSNVTAALELSDDYVICNLEDWPQWDEQEKKWSRSVYSYDIDGPRAETPDTVTAEVKIRNGFPEWYFLQETNYQLDHGEHSAGYADNLARSAFYVQDIQLELTEQNSVHFALFEGSQRTCIKSFALGEYPRVDVTYTEESVLSVPISLHLLEDVSHAEAETVTIHYTVNGVQDDKPVQIEGDKKLTIRFAQKDLFVLKQDSNSEALPNFQYVNKNENTVGEVYPTLKSLYRLLENANVNKYDLMQYVNDSRGWLGSCYGVTLSMVLANSKKLDITNLNSNAKYYYDLNMENAPNLGYLVNYYYLLQYTGLLTEGNRIEQGHGQSLRAFWQSFVQAVKSNTASGHPIMFGFGWGKDHGHSIVACGIREYKDFYLVKLYDNTDIKYANVDRTQYVYLRIEKDSEQVVLYKYNKSENNMEIANYYFNKFPWSFFCYTEYDSIVKADAGNDEIKAAARSSLGAGSTYFQTYGFAPFTLTNARGETLEYQWGGSVSGDMSLLDRTIITNDVPTVRYYIPDSESFTLTHMDGGEKYCIACGDQFYTAEVNGADEIVFSVSDGVAIHGTGYTFHIGMSLNGADAFQRILGGCTQDSTFTYAPGYDEILMNTEGVFTSVESRKVTEDGIGLPVSYADGASIRTASYGGSSQRSVLTLPSMLTTIDSEAFSGLGLIHEIVIPADVAYIADDAFNGTWGILFVTEGSYAETWARQHQRTFISVPAPAQDPAEPETEIQPDPLE